MAHKNMKTSRNQPTCNCGTCVKCRNRKYMQGRRQFALSLYPEADSPDRALRLLRSEKRDEEKIAARLEEVWNRKKSDPAPMQWPSSLVG